MLKIRITYADGEEMQKAIDKINKDFKVLSISKEYKGRGNSIYSNIYLDVENKGEKK